VSWYSEVFEIVFAGLDREKARTCNIIVEDKEKKKSKKSSSKKESDKDEDGDE